MSYICETPVLLIFFNRPSTFEQVFEKVREAKPKTLILAQDGARNEDDLPGIQACRNIAESVDWDCEVIKDYSEKNLGCGVRPYSAISNVLNRFERVIILEDDCIPSQSFFRYCDELLVRYEDDDRIAYISGLNHFETWDCGNYDYFFSRAASIGAWATWKKKWIKYYDYNANAIEDPYIRKLYLQQVGNKIVGEARIASLEKAYKAKLTGEKLSYWDTQWGLAEYTQNMLAIVPRLNLIHNIGVGADSTHAKTMKTTTWIKYKNIVFIPIHEFEFPLRHPSFCACDMEYHELIYKCFGGNKYKSIARKVLKTLGLKR